MSELTHYYLDKAQTSSTSDLEQLLREKGIQDLERLDFPTRKDESWKYSEPKAWSGQKFLPNFSPKPVPFETHLGLNVTFDGTSLIVSEPLPQGVYMVSIKDALIEAPEKIKPYLGTLLKHEDGFKALNSAMLNLGVFIYIAPETKLDRPIVLHHPAAPMHNAHFWRHVVVADESAEVKLVELFSGDSPTAYFSSAVTELFIKPKALLTYFKVQAESLKAFHVGHTYASVAADATLETHFLNLGGAWVRSDQTICLDAPGAKTLLNGIYLPGDQQHHDQHTTVFHQVASCQSEEDYKGVLSGTATAVFDGRVVVDKRASKTQAHQQNKNLLLSDKAQINTKPQLEIDTDDVVCSHGTTVGQLSDDALFYFATRGISTAVGKMLLISGFAHENLAKIKDNALRQYFEHWVKKKLENAHGCSDI